jgi:hypothetical protein
MQVAGVAYAKAFLDAGCLATWAWAACRWLSRQDPDRLRGEIQKGRTLPALTPDGQGRLIQPYLPPEATREQRRLVNALDLGLLFRELKHRSGRLVDYYTGDQEGGRP